jgi:hypothetical protein
MSAARRARSALVLALALVGPHAGCTASRTSTPEVRLDAIRAREPVQGPLGAVAFLTGCWRGRFLDGRTLIEERWTPAEGGLVLGTTRFFRDDRAVDFEFGLIRADSVGVLYLPHPRGRASEHAFRLTRSGDDLALFEAPEHDYPRRIQYRLDENGLEARIDAGADDAEPRIWRLAPMPCAP